MKKNLKFILAAVSSLITITTLSACSLFSKNENSEEKPVLIIESASFTNTYTSITFDFVADKNAIYYKATFIGDNSYSLPRVESSVQYDISNFSDGNYKVFLTAIANLSHSDSNPFQVGTLNKIKPQKSIDNVVIKAKVNECFGIDTTVLCDENESAFLTVEILKNDEVFFTKRNVVPNLTFSTENNLPAGEYKISAFFNETDDVSASEKIFLNGSLSISKRKLQLSDFAADYSRGKIKLSWKEEYSVFCSKKLIITYDGVSTTYNDFYKNQRIQRFMEIDATEFGAGNIQFSLQLISPDEEIYISSDFSQTSTTIEKYRISSAPNFTVEYGQPSGDVTIDFPNYEPSGLYHLTISCVSDSIPPEETAFYYDEDVSCFPIVFEKTNVDWLNAEYSVSLYRKSSTILELNSETTTKNVIVTPIKISPKVDIWSYGVSSSEDIHITVNAEKPDWLETKWWNSEHLNYHVTFSLSNGVMLKELDINEVSSSYFDIINIYSQNKMHLLKVTIDRYFTRGVIIESIVKSFDGGDNQKIPNSTNLAKNFDIFDYEKNSIDKTITFFLEIYSLFPYSNFEVETWYYLPDEPLIWSRSIPYFSGNSYCCGVKYWQATIDYESRHIGQTITYEFAVRVRYAGYMQELTKSINVTL